MKDTYLPSSVWTYPDAIALFFGGLLGSVIIISIGASLNGGNQLADVPLLLLSSSGQALVELGMLTYMSKTRGTSSWDLDFGFRFEGPDILGLLYGAALQFAVVVAVQIPIAWLLHLENPPQQDVAAIAGEASSFLTKILVFVVLVMVAPLTEELLFRGVLLSRLRRDFRPHAAVAISAAVFAGIHLIDPNAAFAVPGLFVIGLVLGYQALHTGRIGLNVATHAGVNLVAAVAILFNLNF
jgi:membrane protease YdiL (CAAX protease family)